MAKIKLTLTDEEASAIRIAFEKLSDLAQVEPEYAPVVQALLKVDQRIPATYTEWDGV